MPDLWNLLYDCSIVALDGVVPGDVRLVLKVPYLPDYKLVIDLHECTRFEWQVFSNDHESVTFTDLETISKSRATILAGDMVNDIVHLHLSGSVIKPRGVTHPLWKMEGELFIEYGKLSLSLDNGVKISAEELGHLAANYRDKT